MKIFSTTTRRFTMKHEILILGMVTLLGVVGVAQAGGDAQAGKSKTNSCEGCHGPSGEGVGSNPPLAGMNEDKFVQAITEYQSGKRSNTAMKAFAKKLNEQDVANIAAYYASLKKK
jgi:cytochrome c553